MEITGINPIVIEEIKSLARQYGVEKVILFGSRARGDYTRASDIDLAVRGGAIDEFTIAVKEETSTLLDFDIIDLDQELQEKLLDSIQREGTVLYEKFENYCSNLAILEQAPKEDLDNAFIVSGVIDKFFIQFELGWKVLKELLKYEGKSVAGTGSPREILKAAYTIYDFIDESVWISMLKNRNDMTHIYDGDAAKRLVHIIIEQYIPAFVCLRDEIRGRYQGVLEDV